MLKTKNINIKVSTDELNTIRQNLEFYKKEGIKLNVSKIVRDILIHFPKN